MAASNKTFTVSTNKVWKGMVAYREQHLLEAIAAKKDLLCTCQGVADVMTIRNADIIKRVLHYSPPQYRDARTGRYDQRLAYYWWWPDGKKHEPQIDPSLPKQQQLAI